MSHPARLSRADRRDQLLDAASGMLLERGAAAITMEGLAVQAGVSKALPYIHFDNAEAVLIGLYQREIAWIGERVTSAMAAQVDAEGRLVAAIHAYFDVVEERGSILSILAGPGSAVPHLADAGSRTGNRFIAEILHREFGVTRRRGLLAAALVLGVLTGAVDAWANQEASRKAAETSAVAIAVHIARSESAS